MDYTPKDIKQDMEQFGDGYTENGLFFGAADQATLLHAFQDRYTGDHKPGWAEDMMDGLPWPLQFKSDAEWLANTRFAVSMMTRRLDRRIKRCWEKPTWPENPTVYGYHIKDLPWYVQARFAPNLRSKGWVQLYNKWIREFQRQERESAEQLAPEPAEMTLAEAIAENQRRAALGLPSLADEEDAGGKP